jgi:hypothetical protein
VPSVGCGDGIAVIVGKSGGQRNGVQVGFALQSLQAGLMVQEGSAVSVGVGVGLVAGVHVGVVSARADDGVGDGHCIANQTNNAQKQMLTNEETMFFTTRLVLCIFMLLDAFVRF